jgi:hypothetical protein
MGGDLSLGGAGRSRSPESISTKVDRLLRWECASLKNQREIAIGDSAFDR